MDLFVVPTFSFRLLYGLVILNHGRRQILWLGVTAHPTAEWIARQLTEACGWDGTPEYLVLDRDSVYISGAPMRPPRPGDTLTATIPVNVRQGPIKGTKVFGWQNQPVACDPTNVGEKFTVMRTVEIVPGYFWTEIKNSVQCTK